MVSDSTFCQTQKHWMRNITTWFEEIINLSSANTVCFQRNVFSCFYGTWRSKAVICHLHHLRGGGRSIWEWSGVQVKFFWPIQQNILKWPEICCTDEIKSCIHFHSLKAAGKKDKTVIRLLYSTHFKEEESTEVLHCRLHLLASSLHLDSVYTARVQKRARGIATDFAQSLYHFQQGNNTETSN